MFLILVSVLAISSVLAAVKAAPMPMEGENARAALVANARLAPSGILPLCIMCRIHTVDGSVARCRYPAPPYELVDCDMLLKAAGKGRARA